MKNLIKKKKAFIIGLMAATLPLSGIVSLANATQSPQTPLAGSAIPQFVNELPTLQTNTQSIPKINTMLGNRSITLRMCEFKTNVLPAGAVANYSGTWVWGYLPDSSGTSTCGQLISQLGNAGIVDTYIGPAIVNNRNGRSTDITWVNELGSAATTNVLAYKYSTDQTLHWADPLAAQLDSTVNMCHMKEQMCMFTNSVTGLSQCYPSPGDPCADNYAGPIPAVAHLHGGEVPSEIDGGPDSWFTSDGLHQGSKYYSFGVVAGDRAIYRYPNTQEAAPIWFHDHTLGATRLNVFMGLAGAYYIQDPALIPTSAGGTCDNTVTPNNCLPANLQPLGEVVPLVLQDRMFDTNGQLFFPSDSAGGVLYALNPNHPYWVPEFVGDTIVVNGKAWPFMNVQAKRYRFLFLNGSNARTYTLSIPSGPAMYVIATDGGYLDKPVAVQNLTMQPGERYEVIIDFAKLAGKTVVLTNTARTPFPKGAPPNGSTTGNIVQFRVAKGAVTDTSYNPALGTPLRSGTNAIVRLVDPAKGTLATGVTAAKTRELTLNEIALPPSTAIDPVTGVTTKYPGGPVAILVNNSTWAGTNRSDFTGFNVNGITTYISELPKEGDTEIWEIVNTTADAHPIHLHLVQFQLINRQNYNVSNFMKAYGAAFGTGPAALPAGCITGTFCPGYGPPLNYDAALNTLSGNKFGGNPDVAPYLQDGINPPLPNEAGWKDTVIMYPGQVTRIAVRFAPTSLATNTPASSLYFPFDPLGTNGYVWHCHIVDHEDNEMMRADYVTPNPAAPAVTSRPLVKGVAY